VRFRAQLLPVGSAVGQAVDPFVQVGRRLRRLADLVPFQVEIVVAVVVALGVGGVRAVGHVADRIDDKLGDQGAVGVRADDIFIDNLFGGQDDVLGGKGGLFLLADDAPQVGVACASARCTWTMATSGAAAARPPPLARCRGRSPGGWRVGAPGLRRRSGSWA
jgi:hypothetical protein